jgi:hypothetical protein
MYFFMAINFNSILNELVKHYYRLPDEEDPPPDERPPPSPPEDEPPPPDDEPPPPEYELPPPDEYELLLLTELPDDEPPL